MNDMLSIEDLEDLYSILNFVKEKGYWDYLQHNISSVEVDLNKLENKLETLINQQ